jgi:hypothetical protein
MFLHDPVFVICLIFWRNALDTKTPLSPGLMAFLKVKTAKKRMWERDREDRYYY